MSVDDAGNPANGESGFFCCARPSTSTDGRFVAFVSDASNLVAGDTNDSTDVFVRDRQTGQTTRVSVDSAGTEAEATVLGSNSPSISADGRYVAFESEADNLVPGRTDGFVFTHVYVHDRQTGATTRVSVDSAGQRAELGGNSPSISADGRFVAFVSRTELVLPDDNSDPDVFVHDRQTGETTRVSVNSAGEQAETPFATPPGSYDPAISANGRFVSFTSVAFNLVSDQDRIGYDIYVHDRQTGETTRASVNANGEQGNSDSNSSSISADGRYVAFDSFADNLVAGDTSGGLDGSDVFVRDRQTGRTTRVSVDSAGTQADDSSSLPSISANGRFVSFSSDATNLVVGDTNGFTDIFLHDRLTGETTRENLSEDGAEANSVTFSHSLSPDGGLVAFQSAADNLVPGDDNSLNDVFAATSSAPPPGPGLPPVQPTGELCANVADGNPFTDDDGTTFEMVIECMAHSGITRGVTATTFEPASPVTRGQMASFIARAIDTANDLENTPGLADLAPHDGNNDFTDVTAGSVHLAAINRLADAQIVRGGPGGRPVTAFGPDLEVTRAQMASFINRAQEYLTGTAFSTTSDLFTDDDGDVHEPNINGIASMGIAVGDGVSSYGPGADVIRGQMAAFLIRHLAVLHATERIQTLPA